MLQEDMKSLREDTYRSWMNANREMVDLGLAYLDDPRLIPVSTDELDLLFSGRGSLDAAWRRFSKKYPGSDGYIEMSRAGLSGDCQQALIYVGRHTPSFRCNGWELLLERHHSYWVISDGWLHWER